MKQPLICLCAIVGNEESVIERFIRSFFKVADAMVFVRAIGSEEADGTEEIIYRTCRELGIAFEFRDYSQEKEWPHVDDFAKARNLAWKLGGVTTVKYLLWADADDLIDEKSAASLRREAELGTRDVYIVPYEVRGKAQIVHRERMVRNDGCSRWHYAIHEMLEFTREVTYSALKDAVIAHAPLAGKSPSMGRNMRILQHEIKDGARYLFFLSQQYSESGQIHEFEMCAKAALAHPGLELLERYEILINLAQNKANEESKGYASLAYQLMPDRREALALLACYAMIDGRNEEAFLLAKHMSSLPIPKKTYWTLNRDWYLWKGFYLLTQTMRAVGRGQDALKLEQEQFQKAGAIFSICHPTYLRPEQALAIRELYLSRADNPMAVEYIFGIHHDDPQSLALLSGFRHTVTDREGCCPNTHEALKASTGKFIMVIADDLIPPQGWDTQILNIIPNVECGLVLDMDPPMICAYMGGPFVLNFNDQLRTDGHLCHAFMTRPWLETLLADPWPGTGIFSDDEFTYRARKAGIVVEAPQIVFEHRHFINGKAPMDATYEDQNKRSNYEEGRRLLMERNPDLKVRELPQAIRVEPVDIFSLAIMEMMRVKGENIRFLQIGAHDGKTLDPLRPWIERLHWGGVLVEPQIAMFEKLKENYADRWNLFFENAALGWEDGVAKLYAFALNQNLPEHATMLASFSKEALIHNGHGYKGEIEALDVRSITLKSLVEKHKIERVDLLQIDTEGFDFEIIKMLEATELRPTIIHFESAMFGEGGKRECYGLLASMGYRVSTVGIDSLACLK